MGETGKRFGRRRADSAAPGADLSRMEQLELIDITLVSEVQGGPTEVPHLGLRFDATGVSVRRPNGDAVVHIPWVSLRRLETAAREDRQASVELAVQSDRRRHRFLVPNVSEEALKASLTAMSARYAHVGLIEDVPRRGLRLR